MKNKNGITLIALVITIVVLLILAGVAISTLGGENGILARAKEARITHQKAEARENIQIAIMDIQAEEKMHTIETTHESLYNKLSLRDSKITLDEYTSGAKILTGTYKIGRREFVFTITESFEVIIGDEVDNKMKKFDIAVSEVTKNSVKVTVDTASITEITPVKYTYIVENKVTGTKTEIPDITTAEYTITGLEPDTEYNISAVAYDSTNAEMKSSTKIIKTLPVEIIVAEPIIGDTKTAKVSVEDNSQIRGAATLYINITAALEGTACTVTNKTDNKPVPYEITEDGTYVFLASGTYNGKIITKEITVITNKYKTYKIYTAQDFQDMQKDVSGYYTVMNNIDMTGFDFKVINTYFLGTLDGQGHTISNLTILNENTSLYTGIFYGAGNCTVKDILFKNANVTCPWGGRVGVIAGSTNGGTANFSKVGITGNITGADEYIASFVGQSSDANFENCYARTTITSMNSEYDLGGFTNMSYKNLNFNNCYWSGTITGASDYFSRTGTFFGRMSTANNNNQQIDPLQVVTNSFYNKELFTLSVPEQKSGKGLTTAEFANSNNFTGWDFTTTWHIGTDGYPELTF